MNSINQLPLSNSNNLNTDNNDSVNNPTISYNDALNKYYILKHNYEININEKIRHIRDSIDDLKTKQDKYKKMTNYCINCKQKGGTIFTTENIDINRVVTASCGAANKCNLNIKIILGFNKLNSELSEEALKIINSIKKKLIIYKNDILFKYKNSTTVEKTIEKFKQELDDENYSLYGDNINDIAIQNKHYNDITLLKNEINATILVIKDKIIEFDKSNNLLFIDEIYDLYVNDLNPNILKLRNIQYISSNINMTSNNNIYKYHLNQIPFDYKNVEKNDIFETQKVVHYNVNSHL
mgnify:FL=1